MDFDIKHDDKTQKFFANVSGKECSLKYEKLNDDLLEYKMMFVPKNLRGQGLADRIAEVAVNFARTNGLKIKTSCSYIMKYIDSHKEVQSILFK